MNRIVKYLRRNIDVAALIESGDIERMKKFLLVKRGVLTPDEKGDLIVAIDDPEFMKACANDVTMGLDKPNLSWIITRTKDGEYIEKKAISMKFRKDSYYKSYLLKFIRDHERIKKYLNDKHIKIKDKYTLIREVYGNEKIVELLENGELDLDSNDKGFLIRKLSDECMIACVRNKKLELDAYDRGLIIDSIYPIELREQFNDLMLHVDKISEISLEQLESLPEDGIVRIESLKKEDKYDYYSKSEFVAIKKVADKILDGIETPQKGDETSELAVFKTIYTRLAKQMSYDYAAIKKKNERNKKWQRDCRNLNGLASGKTVCAGYACILVRMLNEMGMEAQYIKGQTKNDKTAHAWTQVKIGGKWFNTDLTWERDKVVLSRGKVSTRVLKSDRQFRDHKKYGKFRTVTEEKCVTPVTGVIKPKIASYTDEYGMIGSVQRLAQKFSLGISEMQASYGSMLRALHTQENTRFQESAKVLDKGGEIGE